MFRKVVVGGLVVSMAFGGTALAFPQHFTPLTKVYNVTKAGVQIYSIYNYSQQDLSSQNYKAAQCLKEALRKNGGLYLKLGQLIATLDVIVPDEYRETLGTLTRDCPTSSYEKVRATIEEQTGLKVQELFDKFNPQPISSASIGQVHRARLKDSDVEVAVKVQHRELAKNVEYDLSLMRFFVGLANWAFKDFKYNWLLEEFQKNIRIQLDFVQQARNILRVEDLIRREKLERIAVPKVYLPTTKKLLIMQYIKGQHIDELAKMRQEHIAYKDIGPIFAKLIVKMIHRAGFVHADPHAGNLKVRQNAKNQSELVILDHGLYQELSDQLRKSYNRFWLGLILNDKKLYTTAAKELGAKNPAILRSMLTSKTEAQLQDPNRKIFDLNPSSDRMEIMRQASKNHEKIVNTLNELRREILLLLKVNEFARTIQNMLGGRPFGVYEDIAKQCVQSQYPHWWQRWLIYWRLMRA